jgi:acyl carrier protein
VSGGFDAFQAVRTAVAIVCERPAEALSRETRFDELAADSLARVSIADMVEASAADVAADVHIDDAALCRMSTLGDLADYTSSQLTVRVAS